MGQPSEPVHSYRRILQETLAKLDELDRLLIEMQRRGWRVHRQRDMLDKAQLGVRTARAARLERGLTRAGDVTAADGSVDWARVSALMPRPRLPRWARRKTCLVCGGEAKVRGLCHNDYHNWHNYQRTRPDAAQVPDASPSHQQETATVVAAEAAVSLLERPLARLLTEKVAIR